MKKINCIVWMIFGLCSIASAQNKISMPSKQYLMSGCENKIFVQTFMKNNYLAGDIVRFEGNAGYASGGIREKYASIDQPKCGDSIIFKLYDGESFDVKDSKTSVICAGDPSVKGAPVTVQFFGDSFTKGCYFKDAFLERGLVPDAKLIGTRIVSGHEGHYHEGRGGWTVAKYFSNNAESDNFYNPFFQPRDEKIQYWGAVEFWKVSVLINKTGGKDLPFSVRYNCGEYNTSRFGDDGLLLSPKKGDMMYRDGYIVWDGKRWKSTAEPTEWEFNYGKYLKMWEVDAPQFLVVMLGLNDFRDESLPFDFETWNKRVNKMLESYKAAVPGGRMILTTPCTSCGVLDNDRGFFTTRQNAMMWYVRENVIANFDNREEESLYVVDASATIDNENGYNMKGELQTGNPHPYPNYPQLGVPIAACVQFYRNK